LTSIAEAACGAESKRARERRRRTDDRYMVLLSIKAAGVLSVPMSLSLCGC
jgi:hypothetical protein